MEYRKHDLNDKNAKDVQLFAKHMLQSRLFIGSFQEKRYVDSLKSYRDVILVDNNEIELIRDLEVVKKRICGLYGENYWIGLMNADTIGAPAGYSLWVELPDQVFGSYWYKINKVKFRPGEALLSLRIVRTVSSSCQSSPFKLLNISKSHRYSKNETIKEATVTSYRTNQIQNEISSNITSLFTTLLTIQNTKETLKFLSVFFVALCVGFIKLLEYLGDFTIKFMKEMSEFLKTATPIIIACINLIGKVIGGFYLLILGMWRDSRGPPPIYRPPYNSNDMIEDNLYRNSVVQGRRALPAPSRVRLIPL